MKAFLIALILFFPLYMSAEDSSVVMNHDSLSISSDTIRETEIDTASVYGSARSSFYNSSITTGQKPKWYDIEQQRKSKNDAWIFFILLQLLIVLTILKLAFHNDFDNLFKVFANSNIASTTSMPTGSTPATSGWPTTATFRTVPTNSR